MLSVGPGVDMAGKTCAGKQEQGSPSGVNKSPVLYVSVSLAKRGGTWPLRPLLLSPGLTATPQEHGQWAPTLGGMKAGPTPTCWGLQVSTDGDLLLVSFSIHQPFYLFINSPNSLTHSFIYSTLHLALCSQH